MESPEELQVNDDLTEQNQDDLDPTLLLESGRASAIATQSERIEKLTGDVSALLDESTSLKNVTLETVLAENGRFRRRNSVLIAMIFVLVLMQGYNQYRSIWVTGPKLDNIDKTVSGPLTDANAKLDHAIVVLDRINGFLDQVQAGATQSTAENQLLKEQVAQLRDLICISTDPARIEACGETPPPK